MVLMEVRKAKIVCTLGPACGKYEIIREMVKAGMDVARLNFSHGTYDMHLGFYKLVKQAEKELDKPIAVMLDTKGPEIRTGALKGGKPVILKDNQIFILTTEQIEGDDKKVSVSYDRLPMEVEVGQSIFIDDGTIHLVVEEIKGKEIVCRVVVGGELGEHKGVNVPGADLSVPVLTEKDISDIKWGIEHDVDYIAVSFVRTRGDIIEVRKILESFNSNIKIIAKIETRQAASNLNDLINVVDGMMVARGDLGVELPTEEVPLIQKKIIELCRKNSKPVIVATQMLDSMIRNPRPTRAEASDVANAVIDGADALMLSGETAKGKYPIEAVKVMAKIIKRVEKEVTMWQRSISLPAAITVPDAISHASVTIANDMKSSAILSLSRTGSTARMVAKYRPLCPIIAATPYEKTLRELSLVWGVIPILNEDMNNMEDAVESALEVAQEKGLLKEGDLIVITAGIPVKLPGTTNVVQVHTIGKVLLKGIAVVKKHAMGHVVVAKTPQEAVDKISDGDILVVKQTDKDYIPAIKRAGGIIAEEGGLTSHAAIVALDLKIPCIVEAKNATEILQDGIIVTLDGNRGLVYHGKVKLQ